MPVPTIPYREQANQGVNHTMTITDIRRYGAFVPAQPALAELTVVLADDQPVVRSGLRALLSSAEGITVVAEAGSGPDAVREAVLHQPDVLILDVWGMHRQDGIDTIGEVLRADPDLAVLVFTASEDDDSVFAAMRAGARGYLLKGAEHEDIVRTVRGIAAGEAIFCPLIARRLTELLAGPAAHGAQPFPDLTAREREVLDLIAAGMGNTAIARRLQLATKTISNNISAIFGKLRVSSRAEAIARARNAGLGRAMA